MFQTLIYALQVALVGMAIVFIGLMILVFLFKIMSLIVRALTARKMEEAVAANSSATVVSPPVVTPARDDRETIAVIAAAVSSFLGESENGLVIRSIRRIGVNVPSWNAAGRSDIVRTRN